MGISNAKDVAVSHAMAVPTTVAALTACDN